MVIYKILTGPEYEELLRLGEIPGSEADVADGFVHFSTVAQLPGTAEKHFAGQEGLWLLAVEAERLGDALEWEPARGGQLFPHLYRALRLSDVESAARMELGPDGVPAIPDGLG